MMNEKTPLQIGSFPEPKLSYEPKLSPESKVSKGKFEDLRDSLDWFDIDKNTLKDLDKEFEYTVTLPKETTDAILRISRVVKIAVLKLSGYEEVQTEDKNVILFKIKKEPLCSSGVIKIFDSILSAHADESQLAGKRNWNEFKIIARADWGAFYKYCLREKATDDKNLRTVYRNFQDILLNIGEIVCDNKSSLDKLFGSLNSQGKDDFRGLNIR